MWTAGPPKPTVPNFKNSAARICRRATTLESDFRKSRLCWVTIVRVSGKLDHVIWLELVNHKWAAVDDLEIERHILAGSIRVTSEKRVAVSVQPRELFDFPFGALQQTVAVLQKLDPLFVLRQSVRQWDVSRFQTRHAGRIVWILDDEETEDPAFPGEGIPSLVLMGSRAEILPRLRELLCAEKLGRLFGKGSA